MSPTTLSKIETERPEAGQADLRIAVTGMTCASCQAHVQHALENEPGVAAASVNLMMNSAAVTYDPSAATPEKIVEAVRRAGYGAELPAAVDEGILAEQEERERKSAHEFRALRARAIASGIAAVLFMLLSMPLMMQSSAGSAGDPFMRWMAGISPAVERAFRGSMR